MPVRHSVNPAGKSDVDNLSGIEDNQRFYGSYHGVIERVDLRLTGGSLKGIKEALHR